MLLYRRSGMRCLQPGPRKRATVGGSCRSCAEGQPGESRKDVHRALGETGCLCECPASRRRCLPGRPQGRTTGRAPGRPTAALALGRPAWWGPR